MTNPIPFPPVKINFSHVLILEWLDVGDDRTGEKLHSFLHSIGMPSILVVCNSADDIREALAAAHREVSVKGKPAVHIETHGSDGQIREMEFGIAAAPGILWTDLGDWLR